MDETTLEQSSDSHARKSARLDAEGLLRWYKSEARPFLAQHAPELLSPLDNDAERLERFLGRPENVTVCFLGHSGVGKSTLLNALVAGKDQVLPAGGIGPLTALATEVNHSEGPRFRVSYHKRVRLWRLIFALKHMGAPSGATPDQDAQQDMLVAELSDEERIELQGELTVQADAEGHSVESPGKSYLKQAQQIVTGDQFGERPLSYLIDALLMAYGQKPTAVIQTDDLLRIQRVAQALALAEKGSVYERYDNGARDFMTELNIHAAGFLAPLIERIEVGWPSKLLHQGVTLVDLPGVGIAQDAYRQNTQLYIRASARAVILTVDRAGLTSETIELLRHSGYWDRLVGAVDDPASDPCNLFIAVTKVDDVASEEWRNLPEPRPRRRDVYAKSVDEFKRRMSLQIADQLGNIGSSTNPTLKDARAKAKETILATLEIHPVSAPEYRKLLLENEDDPPFLRTEIETGVPALQHTLESLAKQERSATERDISDVSRRFRDAASGELRRLAGMWQKRARAAQIGDQMKKELEEFLSSKKKDRDQRVGAFREFLDATSTTRIRELVGEAREVAEDEVSQYLRGLRNAHWGTLKAAVKRGGAFYGSRDINLPEDVATRFQEPMAAVWSTKLLADIRKRTDQIATDHLKLVDEICDWARSKIRSNSQTELLDQQRQRIKRHADQMRQAGKEAIADLRQTVKLKISDAIRNPIRLACKKFVDDGDHIGGGVKARILELFDTLAKQSTKAAQGPAIKILEQNFRSVRADIKKVFEDWGDPLQDTADLILQRSAEDLAQRSDGDRQAILNTIEALLAQDAVSRGPSILATND